MFTNRHMALQSASLIKKAARMFRGLQPDIPMRLPRLDFQMNKFSCLALFFFKKTLQFN